MRKGKQLPLFKEIEVEPIRELEDGKPPIEATTLWDYPTQSYGRTPKGDNKYPGVTPAFIIYNLIQKYTKHGDLVVDPMAGSGTTLDVCKEGRRCIAYDIATHHLLALHWMSCSRELNVFSRTRRSLR